MDIKKITVNFDFNFSSPYDLSPLAEFNRDKIINRTINFISFKGLIVLNGNLVQDDEHLFVKGKLDQNN